MKLYTADVQGKGCGLIEVNIRATDKLDAIERLKADGWQVVDVWSADLSLLRVDAVLAS